MISTKEWLNEIKRNKTVRNSKFDSTINIGSKIKKRNRYLLKKSKLSVIKKMKKELGRKLVGIEIQGIKQELFNGVV